jgi:hypothetical protein
MEDYEKIADLLETAREQVSDLSVTLGELRKLAGFPETLTVDSLLSQTGRITTVIEQLANH